LRGFFLVGFRWRIATFSLHDTNKKFRGSEYIFGAMMFVRSKVMFVGCSTLLSFQTVTSFDKNGSKSGNFVQRRFKHDATTGEISNWPTKLIRNETKPIRNDPKSIRNET
jgi:hypothetical protein